jgi:hypothetical protein
MLLLAFCAVAFAIWLLMAWSVVLWSRAISEAVKTGRLTDRRGTVRVERDTQPIRFWWFVGGFTAVAVGVASGVCWMAFSFLAMVTHP